MNALTSAWQILLVEDDPHLRIMLTTSLKTQGHLVSTASTAAEAFRIASESTLDLVLLDLGLPDQDGIQLIPLFKSQRDTPIIVISARDQESMKVAALDAGADDYLTKPFGVSELMARMRSAMRRGQRLQQTPSPVRYVFRDLAIDTVAHQVILAGQPVHMTPVEFRILAVLVKQAGRVITHRQFLREVWGPLHEEDGHYLRIYMRQLRRKLEANPAEPRYLLTEPGVGYRLAFE